MCGSEAPVSSFELVRSHIVNRGGIKDSLKTFNTLFFLPVGAERAVGRGQLHLSPSSPRLGDTQAPFLASDVSKTHFFFTPLIISEFRQNFGRKNRCRRSLLGTSQLQMPLSLSLWCADCQLWRSSIVSWTSTCHHSVKLQRRGG